MAAAGGHRGFRHGEIENQAQSKGGARAGKERDLDLNFCLRKF